MSMLYNKTEMLYYYTTMVKWIDIKRNLGFKLVILYNFSYSTIDVKLQQHDGRL